MNTAIIFTENEKESAILLCKCDTRGKIYIIVALLDFSLGPNDKCSLLTKRGVLAICLYHISKNNCACNF